MDINDYCPKCGEILEEIDAKGDGVHFILSCDNCGYQEGV